MYEQMDYPLHYGPIHGGVHGAYPVNPYIQQQPPHPYPHQVYPYPVYPGEAQNFGAPYTHAYPPQMYYEPYEEDWMDELLDYDDDTSASTSRTNRFLAHFQTEEGQYDFDKIFSTAGQFIGIVRQVTPMVSQLGTIVRAFRP